MSADKILVLCECCAFKLANDDESGCRDYYRHDHAGLDVPPGTVISQGPHTWNGTFDLDCRGHENGIVHPGEIFWVAETVENTDDAGENAHA
jgi:hypothetical protein